MLEGKTTTVKALMDSRLEQAELCRGVFVAHSNNGMSLITSCYEYGQWRREDGCSIPQPQMSC